MTHRKTLGFDRKIELAWLDAAAAAAARGEPAARSRGTLHALLDGLIAGSGPHSGRGKTITVLARVWLNPPPEAAGLRSRALELLGAAAPAERVAIHWAMCGGTHAFFVDTASAVGRLLKVQGNASLAQIERRVAEKWGDRSTLRRAVQRVCRTYVAWNVLREGSKRGVYERATAPLPVGSVVGRLLIESVLVGGARNAAPLSALVRDPALFPFEIQVRSDELRTSAEFDVSRQGIDMDVVALGRRPAPRPSKAQHPTLAFDGKDRP